MTESDSKLRHILGTFFPLYSSMSKDHQLALEAGFIPTMKILFDAPITSPLSEIDTEDVGMFFVHLTREDMLQSYDPDKKSTFLESSTTSIHDSMAMSVCNEILSSPNSYQTKSLIKVLTNLALTHNNFVHLKELKVLSELMLQNVKERSCVRSLEKFNKQLLYWLGKDPDNNSVRSGSNKRRSTDSNQDDIDVTPDDDEPINIHESDPKHESDQVKDVKKGEVVEESLSTRTVMTTPSIKEPERQKDTDQTHKHISLEKGHIDDVPQEKVFGESIKEKSSETPFKAGSNESILASSKDKNNEDDIFTDTLSANISKLPKIAVMNDSSDESEDDPVQSIDPKILTEQNRTLEKEENKQSEGNNQSATSSPIPPSTTSYRSSHSSIVSSKCSSRASSVCEETPTTPPTVKKKVMTTRNRKGGPQKNTKTTLANKDTTTSPTSRSRSGRQNTPRFNYRTGASLVEENDSKENIEKKSKDERKSNSNNRKRTKITKSSRSGTSSPQLKKMAGTKVLTKNDYDLTDSSDFEVIDDSTPSAGDVESLPDSNNSDFEIVSQPSSPKR